MLINLTKIKIKYDHNKARRKKEADVKRWEKGVKEIRKLTKAQKKEVLDYYLDMTGQKVSLRSHEYFYSRTGVFTKDYVPLYLYYEDVLPRANKWYLTPAYGNKSIADIVLPKEDQPRMYLKNMNGFFYFDGEPVSREEAIEKCRNLGDVVVKPSGLSKGNGVIKVNVTDGKVDGTDKTFEDLLNSYGREYIVQEAVKQHKDMAALNPTSVNTIRILTYRSENEVLLIYSVVRIGRKGMVIDNQSAGGISTTVDADGRLAKYAFGGYDEDNVAKTDSGVVLENYQLPSYHEAVDMVKKLHMRLPYFRMVGWDVAIREDGQPVMIEFNTQPGLSQSAFCSGMGENTERVIRELWKEKNSRFAY